MKAVEVLIVIALIALYCASVKASIATALILGLGLGGWIVSVFMRRPLRRDERTGG